MDPKAEETQAQPQEASTEQQKPKEENVETQKAEKEVNQEEEEDETTDATDDQGEENAAGYLKDYESLLKYTLKLLGDNKYLMQENLKLRLEAEEMVKMNLTLLQENEKVKSERDKLLSDSMTLIEYNDYLQSSKDNLEKDLLDIKEKFYSILSGMTDLNNAEQEELDQMEKNTPEANAAEGQDKGASA